MLILSQYSMESRAETNQVYLSGASSRPGQEAELTINLRNAESVISYQCTVYLPEGVTLKSISKIQDRGGQESFNTIKKNDGSVMIVGSNNGDGGLYAFTGNDGPIAKIVVSVPDNFTAGEYEVELKEIVLVNASIQSISVNDYTFKWSIVDTFTITFDSNGGTSVESITQDNGTVITPPANPTREGYTFIGWEPALPETMPIGGLAVKAQWVINKYTLTYVIDGQEYSKSEVEYNATITQLDDPVREGYTFSGWSEIPATMPAHDVEVTGSFIVNSYTLTYIVDGNAYKTLTVDYGTAITPEAEPTKEGYTFSGWSEIPATMPANDVEISGSFTVNSYTLTYIVDGNAYKTLTVDYGTAITPEAEPTKEGYTFSGWSEIPATMPANDVEVSGSFAVNSYTLTYIVDGNAYKTLTVDYGTAITPEAEPTKEGYTFSGWSEIPATMPANDVEVSGSFAVNSYTLTYIVDGNAYKTLTVDYGTAITPEAEPTKEGYTFSGWSEIPATMPAHDVEVTGSFTQNIYILDENSDNADVLKQAADVAVQLKRTIKADEWSTICLPFTATGEQVKTAFGDDVQLASFTGWESEEDGNGAIVAINVMFTSVSADEGIAANTPMLIKVSETVTEATFDGVTLEPAEEPMVQVGKKASERGWFYGTYAKTIVPEENLFLSGNEFWYSTGKTAIKGFRGYFEFRDVLDAYYDDSEVKVHMLFDDDATGIETIDHSSLNIDHYYNLAGQRVGKGYKGVVIENGKKIIKK